MRENVLEGLAALLVTHPSNIRYLTGFTAISSGDREAYVLVLSSKLLLFTHSLNAEQANTLVGQSKRSRHSPDQMPLEFYEISRDEPLSLQVKQVMSQAYRNRPPQSVSVGFEKANLTFFEYEKLREELPDAILVPTEGRVERLRQVKRPDEIVSIKKAAEMTDGCFTHVVKRLKPGVTEAEIAWDIEAYFHEKGASAAFGPIVAFSKNSSQPHHVSSPNTKLQARSLILLGFGARFLGYCADLTRVVFAGNPTREQKRVYDTILHAQLAALGYLKNAATTAFARGPLAQGVTRGRISGSAADRAAREVIERAVLPPYPHSLGHCVGLDIHEGPRLSVKKDEEFLPGMAVTVEPAIYLEGRFGIRIEDLVLVTENGIDILSKSPKALTIL